MAKKEKKKIVMSTRAHCLELTYKQTEFLCRPCKNMREKGIFASGVCS